MRRRNKAAENQGREYSHIGLSPQYCQRTVDAIQCGDALLSASRVRKTDCPASVCVAFESKNSALFGIEMVSAAVAWLFCCALVYLRRRFVEGTTKLCGTYARGIWKRMKLSGY